MPRRQTIDADFSGVDCSSLRTPRSPDAYVHQDGVNGDGRRRSSAPLRLPAHGLPADDWVAIFLKSYGPGDVASGSCQCPLRSAARSRRGSGTGMRTAGTCTSAPTPSARPRRGRASDRAVRHVFLEADHDGPDVLAALDDAAICRRRPTCCIPRRIGSTSAGDVTASTATRRALQKRLARELETDPAATPCAQTTGCLGFSTTSTCDPYHVRSCTAPRQCAGARGLSRCASALAASRARFRA